MIRRPPRSTRTDTLFPTRRSSDLLNTRCTNGWPDEDCVRIPPAFVEPMAIAACPPRELPLVSTPAQSAGGGLPLPTAYSDGNVINRPEERCVGTECVSTCRSRWSRKTSNKQENKQTITRKT